MIKVKVFYLKIINKQEFKCNRVRIIDIYILKIRNLDKYVSSKCKHVH